MTGHREKRRGDEGDFIARRVIRTSSSVHQTEKEARQSSQRARIGPSMDALCFAQRTIRASQSQPSPRFVH
jgi:hypothetical protein